MILYISNGSLLVLELSIILLEFCLSPIHKIRVYLRELLEHVFQVRLIFLSQWVLWVSGCTLVPMVLTGVGMISVPRNIGIGVEVVPLNIHVINLLIRGRICSTLSIQMVPMAKITTMTCAGEVLVSMFSCL